MGALLNRSLFHVGLFRHLKHVLHFHVRHFQRPRPENVGRAAPSKLLDVGTRHRETLTGQKMSRCWPTFRLGRFKSVRFKSLISNFQSRFKSVDFFVKKSSDLNRTDDFTYQ